MTRETLNKLPEAARDGVEELRRMYKNLPDNRDAIHKRASGYTCGLRDAGLITDRERQIIFIYITL